MKRIHILLHVHYETPGCIEAWIMEKGYIYSSTTLYADETLPDISDIDWLVVMGGPMSVHDTVEFPWLEDEKRFIKDAVTHGKVLIGICLGSQLIAEALGSRVYKNSVKEIGWFPVMKNSNDGSLSLLRKFNDIETVFHWHGDTFDIPEAAVHIMYSDGCRNQCYIYNEKIVGLQFHVEVTADLLESMIVHGIDEIVPDKYIQDTNLLRNGALNIKRNNELMFSILNELDGADQL